MKLAIVYRNGKRFVVSNVLPLSLVINSYGIHYEVDNPITTVKLGDGVTASVHSVDINVRESQASYAILIHQATDDLYGVQGELVEGRNLVEFKIIPLLDDVSLDIIQDGLKWAMSVPALPPVVNVGGNLALVVDTLPQQ